CPVGDFYVNANRVSCASQHRNVYPIGNEHGNRYADQPANRDEHTNAKRHENRFAHGNRYVNSERYQYSNRSAIGYAEADRYSNPGGDRDGDSDRDSDKHSAANIGAIAYRYGPAGTNVDRDRGDRHRDAFADTAAKANAGADQRTYRRQPGCGATVTTDGGCC